LDLLPEIDGIVDLLKHSQFDFMSNATKQSVKALVAPCSPNNVIQRIVFCQMMQAPEQLPIV
jgi:hypothetical protein